MSTGNQQLLDDIHLLVGGLGGEGEGGGYLFVCLSVCLSVCLFLTALPVIPAISFNLVKTAGMVNLGGENIIR